jgi:hypothetical protein
MPALLDVGALCSGLAAIKDFGGAAHAKEVLRMLRAPSSADRGASAWRQRVPRRQRVLPAAGWMRTHSFGGAVTTFDYKKLRVCGATAWDQVAFAADGAAASIQSI